MCLIGVKETYVQEKKKVTKNFLGQICTTVSGLKLHYTLCYVCVHVPYYVLKKSWHFVTKVVYGPWLLGPVRRRGRERRRDDCLSIPLTLSVLIVLLSVPLTLSVLMVLLSVPLTFIVLMVLPSVPLTLSVLMVLLSVPLTLNVLIVLFCTSDPQCADGVTLCTSDPQCADGVTVCISDP